MRVFITLIGAVIYFIHFCHRLFSIGVKALRAEMAVMTDNTVVNVSVILPEAYASTILFSIVLLLSIQNVYGILSGM